MTLTELRYIVALTQGQNFGRAESCHVSQPIKDVAEADMESRFEPSAANRLRC